MSTLQRWRTLSVSILFNVCTSDPMDAQMTCRGSRQCGWLHSVITAAPSTAVLPSRISVWITPSQRPARFQLDAPRWSTVLRQFKMAERHLTSRGVLLECEDEASSGWKIPQHPAQHITVVMMPCFSPHVLMFIKIKSIGNSILQYHVICQIVT